MDREYIFDELGKIDMLPTLSWTVGEMTNGIEDPMSSAANLMKSKDPSMANEALRVVDTACFGTRNFRNMNALENAITIISIQEAKEDREHTIVTRLGNMFAKRINLRDNFFGSDQFPKKYKDFVYILGDFGMKLMLTEDVKLSERINVRKYRRLFEDVLEEKYD
jgi:hypothetical protein